MYSIESIGHWEDGRLAITPAGGETVYLTIDEIRTAARQLDPELAAFYGALQARAEKAIEGNRRASVRRCPGHKTAKPVDVGFSGPVSENENPAAHGNICRVERCVLCGAERLTNINGHHTETGEWH
jgi:hypothetical protein